MPDSKRPATAWLTATEKEIEYLHQLLLPTKEEAAREVMLETLVDAYLQGWADCDAAHLARMMKAEVNRGLMTRAEARAAMAEAQQQQAQEAGQGEHPEGDEA